MTKLFIASLKYDVDEDALSAVFSAIGPLASCQVARDTQSGKSLGYAFVEFQSPNDAAEALRRLDGSEIHGRHIVVKESTRRVNHA